MGWAFLSGAAGYLSNRMAKEQELKEKQLQEEAMMKRQMMLEKYRNDLEAQRQLTLENERSKNTREEKQAEHELSKGDVVGQYQNPRTGEVIGRTRGGDTVQLYQPSKEESDYLRRKQDLELSAAQAQAAHNSATARHLDMQDSLIEDRKKLIRASANLKEAQANGKLKGDSLTRELVKQYGQAQALTADDPTAQQAWFSHMENTFGRDEMAKAFPGKYGAAQPAQGNKPSIEDLMKQAQDAVQRGADPNKVEERLKQLMNQYGYKTDQ